MSKSILVIDTPECCIECPMCISSYSDDEQYCYCCATNGLETIWNEKQKSEWCPLKEVPKRKRIHSTDPIFQRGAKNGYNACIDEILKGD